VKFLLNLRVLPALGLLFQLVPNPEHLNGAWQKGYTLAKALYDFVMHFHEAPTPAQLHDIMHEVDAEAEAQATAENVEPVPAQAPPVGPVSDTTVAPRSTIEL
jgi:hypothetical protein